MINVVIITQDEPFFIPKMMDILIRQKGSSYRICGITVLKPYRKNKSLLHWIKERSNVYSYSELFLAAIAFLFCSLHRMILKSGSHFSVKSMALRNDIRLIEVKDINTGEFINKIKSLHVDVVVSISCPQLFGAELLQSPNIACINAHGTLLPRHRGVFGSWWTLFNNDKEAGSTIHTMEQKLDAGEIIWQKSFDVENTDTQFSIAYKTKRDMANGLVEVLNEYASGKPNVLPHRFDSSYHRSPSKELGVEFHRKGKRVLTFKDLRLMLSKAF